MSALWPTGSTTQPRFSDTYGPRSGIAGARNFHYGVDIPMALNAPVHAARRGVVIFSGSNGSLGQQVVIQTDVGQFLYPHMKEGSLVPRGATVEQGQQVGLVGMTGLTTGPHSCFRTFEGSWQRDADARNPAQFMARLNGGAPASTVIIGIILEEEQQDMKVVLHRETGGVYGMDQEFISHFTSLASAQYVTNVFTADDKIIQMNTPEFQATLQGLGIPFQHPDRLRTQDPGGSWSRAQDNANQLAVNQQLLNKLVTKLGA